MYKVKRFSKGKLRESKSTGKKLNKEEKAGLIAAGAGIGTNTAAYGILDKTEGGPFKMKDQDKLAEKIRDRVKGEGLGLREATWEEKLQLGGKKNAFYSPGTREVIDAGLGHKADILAHELGHHKVQTSKNRLVRATQGKIGNIARIGSVTGGTMAGSLLAGSYAGKKAAEAEARGEKEGFGTKYGHMIAAGAANLPILASEAMASGHGLKELKSAGASKKDLAKATGNLALAGLSYAGLAGANIGAAQYAKGKSKKNWAKKIAEKENKKKSK